MKSKKLFNLFIFSLLAALFMGNMQAQEGTVTIKQDEKIPELLMLKKKLEKENKLSDKYTIQLYYGELNRAQRIRANYRNKYGSWPSSIEYETPNYKVWVGNFASRIDADRALLEVKRNFPEAFVLQPN